MKTYEWNLANGSKVTFTGDDEKLKGSESIDGLHILTFTFPDFEADVLLDANPRLMASRLINLARTIEKASR